MSLVAQEVRAATWEWSPLGDVMVWSSSPYGGAGAVSDPTSLKAWLRSIPGRDRGAVLAAMAGALAKSGTFDVEHRVRTGHAATSRATTRGIVLPSATGEGVVVVGTTTLGGEAPADAPPEPEAGEAHGSGCGDDAAGRAVADLVDVSRLAGGRVELERRPIDLVALAASVQEPFRLCAAAAGIRFHSELDAEPVLVLGDEERLGRVAATMLSNAVRFAERGGWVGFAVERSGANATMTVRDNGRGIAAEALESVFELGREGRGPHDGTSRGAGLGLAIARRVVALHGGEMSAFSPGRNQGATFTVRLPAAPG